MTNAQQGQQSRDESTGTADRPAQQVQAPRKSATPAVFADGSTREQQQQLVKEAEEANAQVKKFADAERKARNS